MKIVSFNVNSVRLRMHQLQAIIDTHAPALIALQETKVADDAFPVDEIKAMGYDVCFHGQKTHYGVATMSRLECVGTECGYPGDTPEDQKRMIKGVYKTPSGQPLTLINGYFPQGENRTHPVKFPAKQKFYADLSEYLTEHDPKTAVVVTGDFNVAPLDVDIGIGPDNAKRWLRTGATSFLPEEREWLQAVMDWGLTDTYRQLYPQRDDLFSWFDYRSRGFERDPKRGLRIDHVLATASLCEKLKDAGIDYAVRGMEKPSDHCPIWSEFDFD